MTQLFITEVNNYTGLTFRLPSEAEWEYACRAGNHTPPTRFYWGDDPGYTTINDYEWWYGNSFNVGEQYAHLVGQKLPNAFGLYDMSGNAWEWCEDDWHPNYILAPTNGLAWVDSPRGFYRVLRSGSWYGKDYACRSACRTYFNTAVANFTFGLRLAR